MHELFRTQHVLWRFLISFVICFQDRSLGAKLHTGDFYLTKHSNLSEVHAVFHLVVDESVRTGDITSRHPAILSIRNIIRLCFRYDIQTLTIPLLLTHEMTEVCYVLGMTFWDLVQRQFV